MVDVGSHVVGNEIEFTVGDQIEDLLSMSLRSHTQHHFVRLNRRDIGASGCVFGGLIQLARLHQGGANDAGA